MYLPTEEMYQYLRDEIPFRIIDVLPPGCKIQNLEKENEMDLTLLYVGGIGEQYQIHKILEVVSKMKRIKFLLCCRQTEWEKEKIEYEQYLTNNIEIHHKSGKELELLYRRADIGMVYFKPDFYREFAMPYKVFEYLGHGIPIISSTCTAAGKFVEEEKIGWTINYDSKELEKLLLILTTSSDEILQKSARCREILKKNTWEERAKKVQMDLSK